MKRISVILSVVVGIILAGCRGELPVIPSEIISVAPPSFPETVKGVFVLNEGNMGSNKCTLDFLDYNTGEYHRNIYAERNPNVVKELGDVGNDVAIYGNKLFAVINCSNFVEVMDVRTGTHIGSINITNCRYIVFHNGKAYVSSYAGPVQIDPNARPGKVVEVDINTLQITREVVVGYQPEEMVVHNGKLYVANSGGYRFPDYDRTVSVVDLESMQVIKSIDVAINLHRMEIDEAGRIYVSSRGDYYGTGSDVFVIDSSTDRVVGHLGIAANEMCLCDGILYMISTEWNYTSGKNTIGYARYDTKSQTILKGSIITDGTDKDIKIPYGIAVNPETKEILITDATNYVTPGYVYCFSAEGKLKWKVRAGDIPAHFAFTTKDFDSI